MFAPAEAAVYERAYDVAGLPAVAFSITAARPTAAATIDSPISIMRLARVRIRRRACATVGFFGFERADLNVGPHLLYAD